MIIINENCRLYDFKAWSGAKDTQKTIIEASKVEEFENFIDECYPEGLTDIQLNDFLWFDNEYIFEFLGLMEEPEETKEQ